eukprot:SAG22_NODE_1676_length_3830_cov_3.388100_2_plen_56_part_00
MMEVEQLITSNLEQVHKLLAVAGPAGQLMLTGATIEMVFVPSEPPPIPPADDELV